MFWQRLAKGLTENRAETDPASPDPLLRGRTYAVSFDEVWKQCLDLVQSGRRWRITYADDQFGVIRAEATTLIFKWVDDVQISIKLDENALTRVDMTSASRKGKGDWSINAWRVGRFFKRLDKRLGASAGLIVEGVG